MTEIPSESPQITMDNKTTAEAFLKSKEKAMACASVCIKSHRPMHVMEFRDSPESNPPKCRVVTERTDSNKKLWLCYDKRGFPKDFKWEEVRLISFVRELSVTKNKRELLDRNRHVNGFPTHWNNNWHKMKFGSFLFQNQKVCELTKDEDKSDKFFIRFRISFDHLNQNLIKVNKEVMKSKRPIAEVIIVLETSSHICVSSLFFKHFTGKGPLNRQGQALFDTYDCTSFLFNMASRPQNKVTFADFEKGIERYKGPNAPEYSFFQNKLDHSKFEVIHAPSRHTPVVFGGGNAASAASRLRQKELKKQQEKNGIQPPPVVEQNVTVPPVPVPVPIVAQISGITPVQQVPPIPQVPPVPLAPQIPPLPQVPTLNMPPQGNIPEGIPQLVSKGSLPIPEPIIAEENTLSGNKRKLDELEKEGDKNELEPPQKKRKLD